MEPIALATSFNAATPDLASEEKRLRRCAGDCRVLAVALLLVSCVLAFLSFAFRRQGLTPFLLAVGTSVAVLGPGTWYLVTSFLIVRGHRRSVVWSNWCAIGQIAVIGIGMATIPLNRPPNPLAAPAMVGLFFVPALLALMWQLRQARLIIERIGEIGRAFEVVPVAGVAMAHLADGDDEARNLKSESTPTPE